MDIDYMHHDSITTANPSYPMDSDSITSKPVMTSKPDMVNHPPHYTAGKFECIDVIKDVLSFHKDAVSGWLTAQCLKYLWRWPLKNGVEDLKKIRFYLDHLIEHEESKND